MVVSGGRSDDFILSTTDVSVSTVNDKSEMPGMSPTTAMPL